jgi:hypothetical protein
MAVASSALAARKCNIGKRGEEESNRWEGGEIRKNKPRAKEEEGREEEVEEGGKEGEGGWRAEVC